MAAQPGKPRVLIFSLRNIFGKALNRCPHYEFEDIICEIDSAELLAPTVDPSSRRASFATRLAYHAPVALNPGIPKPTASGKYDLLFTICGFPQDLIMFNAVSNLKDVCRTSVCLLDELWAKDIHKHRHFLPILAKFEKQLYGSLIGVPHRHLRYTPLYQRFLALLRLLEAGELGAGWPSQEQILRGEDEFRLHPAVFHTASQIPLSPNGRFDPVEFRCETARTAKRMGLALPPGMLEG